MSDKKQISGWKKFLQSMTKAHELGKEEEIMTDHDISPRSAHEERAVNAITDDALLAVAAWAEAVLAG